jgi:hypothetical protein
LIKGDYCKIEMERQDKMDVSIRFWMNEESRGERLGELDNDSESLLQNEFTHVRSMGGLSDSCDGFLIE